MICQDEWHLSWEEMIKKYGSDEEARKRPGPFRTCPTCGEKKIYGD